MTPVDPPFETTEPEALLRFLAELRASGFAPTDSTERRWRGPLPGSLHQFTTSREMTVVFRDGWPYQPPAIEVAGISGWHADHGHACLWQEGDASLLWQSFDGVLARIDAWASSRNEGFGAAGAALDAWLYFETPSGITISIDMGRLCSGSTPRPDQSGDFSIEAVQGALVRAVPGRPPGARGRGRWFAIAPPAAPPTNLEGVKALLPSAGRRQLQRQLDLIMAGKPQWSAVGLVWTGPYGTELVFVTLEADGDGGVRAGAMRPTPEDVDALRRRAGPNAGLLQGKRIALFGLGSIGSHLALNLASSGCGFLRVIDSDLLLPVNLVRHAAPAYCAGYPKAEGVREMVGRRCPWTQVEPIFESPWAPARLRDLIADTDIVIDATGNDAFCKQLSIVCAEAGRVFISAALYRGGRIARVRRQQLDDLPISRREHHWRYRSIPADDADDYLGLEVGCASPVTNAPPTAAVTAAALAADTAIDLLCGRASDDEQLVVLRPLDVAPFDRVGRVRSKDSPDALYLAPAARNEILTQSTSAYPNETGGILVGVMTATGEPWVLRAIEIPPVRPSPGGYELPCGRTGQVIEEVRRHDDRLGYLGEWHSHPNRSGPSPTDIQTMQRLAQSEALAGHRPVLIVARRGGETYELSASIATDSTLVDVALRASGPLPAYGPMEAST